MPAGLFLEKKQDQRYFDPTILRSLQLSKKRLQIQVNQLEKTEEKAIKRDQFRIV